MSIIVQAGHKTSKSKQVMEKLYERGLSRPADSYTHKMTPEQVSETLYKVLVREDMSSANEKMAGNVMIDFLLANLDFENWGWESDKNLASLEYWGQIEHDVRFTLVFDHPKNVLSNLKNKKITTELLDQIMSDWVSYHQAMLDFFEKNQDTAILIEGGYALKNINSLGVQVKHIAKTIQLKSSWQVISGTAISIENSNSSSQLQLNVVKDNIFAEIINKYPEAIKVFNTLLDKSSIKNSDLIYKTKRTSLDSLVESLNYLQLEEEKKSSLAHIEKNLAQKDQENQRLNRELQELNSKRQVLENELKKINNRTEGQTQSNQPVDNDIKEENELLISEIHKLQEELEKYFLENKRLNSVINSDKNIKSHYGAAERIKNELPYRLGSMIVKSNDPKALAKLPIKLVKEIYHYNKNSESYDFSMPPVEEYADSLDAERLKKHLSYKVGYVITEGIKNPKKMILIPFEMKKAYDDFKNNNK